MVSVEVKHHAYLREPVWPSGKVVDIFGMKAKKSQFCQIY